MSDLFTMDQIEYLKKYFDDRYDEKFVHVDNCNETQEKINDKLANDDTRIKLFEQKMDSLVWVLKLIATSAVGTLITSILSLILK